MTHGDPSLTATSSELVRVLDELVAALDRRVPRIEQAGEADIARDAAALRARAVARLAELTRSPPVSTVETDADPRSHAETEER